MSNAATLPHNLDRKTMTCRAVIETPKGSRSKFDYDEESGLFRLAGLLPEGMSFPLDFGFFPSTKAEDGDPLDVLVLHDEPIPVGALLTIRLIGVIEVDQTSRGIRCVTIDCWRSRPALTSTSGSPMWSNWVRPSWITLPSSGSTTTP